MWNDDDDEGGGYGGDFDCDGDGGGDDLHLGKRVAVCCRARDVHLFPLLHLDIGDHF